MVDSGQLAKIQELVDRSLAAGARLMQGRDHCRPFFRPTVLADCHPGIPSLRRVSVRAGRMRAAF